jgi:hypothetical protein
MEVAREEDPLDRRHSTRSYGWFLCVGRDGPSCGAALTGNWTVQAPALKSKTPDVLVEAFRLWAVESSDAKDENAATASLVKQILTDVAELVLANIHGGRVDGGMALLLKPQGVTLLAGGREPLAALRQVIEGAVEGQGDWLPIAERAQQGLAFSTASPERQINITQIAHSPTIN